MILINQVLFWHRILEKIPGKILEIFKLTKATKKLMLYITKLKVREIIIVKLVIIRFRLILSHYPIQHKG